MAIRYHRSVDVTGLFIIVMGIFFIGSLFCDVIDYNKEKKLANFLCEQINTDITRPEGRKCVKGKSYSDGLSSFETMTGSVEEYFVIPNNPNSIIFDTDEYHFIFNRYVPR